MTGEQRLQRVSRDSTKTDVYNAWERFVQGEDDVYGVRPEVAISWQRSRDLYRIDPFLTEVPNAPFSEVSHSLDQDVVFAELGFCAAAMVHEVAEAGGVVTIADASGRVLSAWGDKTTRSIASAGGLAPWFSWSEGSVGTNSMGTALVARRAVMIRQSEHWCQAFHEWSCAGIAVRDVVSKEPLAILNISSWRRDLPLPAKKWLESAATHTQNSLRKRAHDSGSVLLAAYTEAQGRSRQPLVAIDTAGGVVIADDMASVMLGVPGNVPAVDAVVRWTPQLPPLIQAARYATKRANADPAWTGSTQIFTPLADEPSTIGLRPVFLQGNLVGHLVSFGAVDGEQFPQTEPGGVRFDGGRPRRVVALREENRMVMLKTSEVTMAEADGTGVWLHTADGRLRATLPSLDKLDNELASTGSFLRVHRQYLVNLGRIREVERREKGELVLVMDDPQNTMVPVSRRSVRAVRAALGI
ncbi:LytTR family transcriptional regulator DNA-binding domain-containing protein [Pseudarthrobacter sp. J75]|uniref:DNA-binding protein n=1 Tax=unclassified Pseudarthrobacter TaxID=2647000 RepID=UPI002E812177|nr:MULTISPECIES: LytTR family transcriptional regulator DNA-binding domain-containing protein [unclassified Pseudarthrobacter]MEE2523814.1 LytTR family transcriptional regulator DNA-binding domain-containing protein [Pseudarthrobacter sp. J47]MEE2529980.1 LytTR family transcriptional regulator DNA-binding domain-containing protein [Pseudarthrobacter sp. J75]MEE2571048.1 LytTR family transcriptional regulator DNA-binding domain-containing protein [Pseudarthrobacter sp. J64]